MKTIYKLILKSYFGPMIMTFFIVMFVLLMNFMWRYIDELVGKGLSAGIIIELVGYALANMVPMGAAAVDAARCDHDHGQPRRELRAAGHEVGGHVAAEDHEAAGHRGRHHRRGSFFIANNLLPYTNKKMLSTLYDIRQQQQTLEFQDGLFFNGIDGMSIRVGHQDSHTGLLTDVLIYDNREKNTNNMRTIVADSGYIRLTDDKRYLNVTLFHGQNYQQTRNIQWYSNSTLEHHIFDKQDMFVPIEGFDMQRSDADNFSGRSQTQNLAQLERAIDSLERIVDSTTTRSYEPLLRDQIFSKDPSVLPLDTLYGRDKRAFRPFLAADSLAPLALREKARLWTQARNAAKNSRSLFSYDESAAKDALNQLYRSKVEWHSKLSLPVSILLFS